MFGYEIVANEEDKDNKITCPDEREFFDRLRHCANADNFSSGEHTSKCDWHTEVDRPRRPTGYIPTPAKCYFRIGQ